MAIIDLKLPKSIARALNLPIYNPRRQQLKVLKKLLRLARFTQFGQAFKFDEILMSRHSGKKFQQLVPTYNYSKIYEEWWHKAVEGTPDVCWPGVIKYFALSSGTSEAAAAEDAVGSLPGIVQQTRLWRAGALDKTRNFTWRSGWVWL